MHILRDKLLHSHEQCIIPPPQDRQTGGKQDIQPEIQQGYPNIKSEASDYEVAIQASQQDKDFHMRSFGKINVTKCGRLIWSSQYLKSYNQIPVPHRKSIMPIIFS